MASFGLKNGAAKMFNGTYTVCRCWLNGIRRHATQNASIRHFLFHVWIDFRIDTNTNTHVYQQNAFVMPYEFSPSHELGFDSVSKSASSSSNSGSPLSSSNTFQKQLLPTKKV